MKKMKQKFRFANYSDAIISIINGSYQKCSIALYGEWGSPKTTLMKWELIRSILMESVGFHFSLHNTF